MTKQFLHLVSYRWVDALCVSSRICREEVLSQWGSMCGFVPGWLWAASRVQGVGSSCNSVNFEVVMRGLTTNHKRLLKCIAELQLAQIGRYRDYRVWGLEGRFQGSIDQQTFSLPA